MSAGTAPIVKCISPEKLFRAGQQSYVYHWCAAGGERVLTGYVQVLQISQTLAFLLSGSCLGPLGCYGQCTCESKAVSGRHSHLKTFKCYYTTKNFCHFTISAISVIALLLTFCLFLFQFILFSFCMCVGIKSTVCFPFLYFSPTVICPAQFMSLV